MAKHNGISQRKNLAMGNPLHKYADGGRVNGNTGAGVMRTGIPDGPVEAARRSNGVPGFKHGGEVK